MADKEFFKPSFAAVSSYLVFAHIKIQQAQVAEYGVRTVLANRHMNIKRSQFIKLLTINLLTATLASACRTRRLLQNENRPDYYNIRYYQPFDAVNTDRWQLSIGGLVETGKRLSLNDMRTLPRITVSARIKCVECWSFRASWGGVHYTTLAGLVKPDTRASWVHLKCADGYYEAVPIGALMDPRVVFAYMMNDGSLPPEYGGPLRIVLPSKYGYKWAKCITAIDLSDVRGNAFWPDRGPYPFDGVIGPGTDHPQEWPGTVREITDGEITDY